MTMTVKQVAEFFGKSETTIRRACKDISIFSENGKTLNLDKEQVEAVADRLFTKLPFAVQKAIDDTFAKDKALPLPIEKVNQEDRLTRMENILEKLIEALPLLITQKKEEQKQLPIITIIARDKIRECLSAFSYKTGVPYKEVWNEFYQKIYFHLHINAPLQAKHNKDGLKPLDILERNGLIDKSLSIAYEFFK